MKTLRTIPLIFLWLLGLLTLSLLAASMVAAHANESLATMTTANTANASNVRFVGHIGGAMSVGTVISNTAYVGEGSSLTILDVSQLDKPRLLGRTQPLPGYYIADLVVKERFAYVLTGDTRLHIFDIALAARPLEIGYYDLPSPAAALHISGTYAYVAARESGLRVISIGEPTTPVEVGFYNTPGSASDVYVANNYAYVTDSDQGLRIVNVTNPTAPVEVGSLNIRHYTGHVYVVGNYAYVANGTDGLRIIRITDPTAPLEVGWYDTPGLAFDVFVRDNLAYLADGTDGLYLVDVTNPATPTKVAHYDSPGFVWSVSLWDQIAYVINSFKGLRIVDISNPVEPTEIGFYETPGSVQDVFVVDTLAYLADGINGLRIVDATSPTTPNLIGSVDTPGYAEGVYVVGNYAYVADGANGLRVINLVSPAAPVEVGFYDTPGVAKDLVVAGSYAYVADSESGLRVINLANLATPVEVGFYDTPGVANDVYVAGNYAYVADGASGLQVVNIANPALPVQAGVYDTPGSAMGVYVTSIYALVADYEQGLRVINVANPTTPGGVGSVDTPGLAESVYVAGNEAYVADHDSLQVISLANPIAPTIVGSYSLGGIAFSAVSANNTIYVARSSNGLELLRYPACYQLLRKFTGSGAVPVAAPVSSTGCQADQYLAGELLTLSAKPALSWRVASWVGANNEGANSLNNLVTMPAAEHEVIVNYAPICYGLTLTHTGTGNNPSATPTHSPSCAVGQYVAGQLITLTAAPGVGSTVGGWSGTSNDSSTANSNTLLMPATNHTTGVSYGLACYSLTLAHTGSGGDPVATPGQSAGCPDGAYHFEETVTLSANPASGWQVSAWSGTTNNSLSSPANTLIMPAVNHTVIVHYGEIPTTAPGDLYELDNSCTRSRTITTDGSEVQEHSFHAGGDVDWVRFDAAAHTNYRIDVTVPTTSTADVVMEVYADCASAPLDQWTGGFSPGARLDISRTVSGPTYVRLSNDNASTAGNQVRYALSVRKLGEAPANRLLIIVAGRLKLNDRVQANIDKVASNVYKLFQRNGYTDDNIHLLASNANLPGYDGAASKASLQAALQQAATKVTNGVLTLYMVDHGSPELFYIDGVNEQTVTPGELNDWLTQLESAAPGVKINVIIEACESGSFIDKPASISKPGRVVLTSSNADNDAKASKEGAYFSDHLITWLQQGFNLSASFLEARTAAKSAYSLQEAWIDSNGNGLANEFDDSALAAQRAFAYAGTLADNEWPPHIFQAALVGQVSEQKVRLRVDARDNSGVRQVWAVLYPPGYTPPAATQVLQPEVLPTFLLTRVDNNNHWEAEVTGLTQPGIYRLMIQADDEQGLVARPAIVEVNTDLPNGWTIFLPTIQR